MSYLKKIQNARQPENFLEDRENNKSESRLLNSLVLHLLEVLLMLFNFLYLINWVYMKFS